MINSVKELCDKIWYLENKYNLLDFEIDGVKPWQFRRLHLYFTLSEKVGILEQSQPTLSIFRKAARIFMLIKNSFLQNSFSCVKKDVLVFTNERSKQVEGEYIDIYTEYLRANFINNKLHPAEYGRWKENPFLVELNRKQNVNIVLDISLYEIFSVSEQGKSPAKKTRPCALTGSGRSVSDSPLNRP